MLEPSAVAPRVAIKFVQASAAAGALSGEILLTAYGRDDRLSTTAAIAVRLTVDPANGEAAYTVTVSDETAIPTPVRAGFVFAGWKVSGTSLTAQWKKNDVTPPEQK